MIYVTHDQVEAMTMGDRIVVMKDGLIQQVAEPIDLYDNPKNMFVAGFIGSPPMNFFKGTIQQQTGALWFHEDGGMSVRINDPMAAKLTGHVGKQVVFGCRPEDINDQAHASYAQPDQVAGATVEVVEPMGAEVYIYLNTGKHSFVARVNGHQRATVGQKLTVAFDMKKCHFFDGTTEAIIV
jgi:multiple sugar transport system ATP-binding protein